MELDRDAGVMTVMSACARLLNPTRSSVKAVAWGHLILVVVQQESRG